MQYIFIHHGPLPSENNPNNTTSFPNSFSVRFRGSEYVWVHCYQGIPFYIRCDGNTITGACPVWKWTHLPHWISLVILFSFHTSKTVSQADVFNNFFKFYHFFFIRYHSFCTSCKSTIIFVISYLGMKSWDLHVCDRASTITYVDRVKKVIPDTTRYDFA